MSRLLWVWQMSIDEEIDERFKYTCNECGIRSNVPVTSATHDCISVLKASIRRLESRNNVLYAFVETAAKQRCSMENAKRFLRLYPKDN